MLWIAIWIVKQFGLIAEKKDDRKAMMEEYGKHKATMFNVGDGKSRKDTGVRYSDVAGLDTIKRDIEETMKMVMHDPKYHDMGA